MLEFMAGATAATEMWEVGERHSVIETDPTNGHEQVIGPFADAYRAVMAAQAMVEQGPENYDKPFPTYRVVAHFSPEESGLTPEGETTHFMLSGRHGAVACFYCKDTAEALGEGADAQPCPVGNDRGKQPRPGTPMSEYRTEPTPKGGR